MSHFTYVYDGWKLIDEPRHDGYAALDSLKANPHSDGGDRLPGGKRSQYDPLGTEEAYYVQGPGADEPLTRNPTIGQISYYNQDGNGNVTALTDSSGNVIEHYTYDPFGNVTITSSTGMVMTSSSVGNRFLFTGREYIAEIGGYDYRNRVYSPGLGRFLQTDPLRFQAGDINIYRYCGNAPISNWDPFGLATYTQNRWINSSNITSNINPLSHTFIYTTNPDGSLKDTYSWGNKENKKGWNKNKCEDRKAANDAIKNSLGQKEGDDDLDPYVNEASNLMNRPDREHPNGYIGGNCKTEAGNLLGLAKDLKENDY